MYDPVIKLFRVEIRSDERTFMNKSYYVEAITINDALGRVSKVDPSKVKEVVDVTNLYTLIPMDPRERAEIEADAKRLGLS